MVLALPSRATPSITRTTKPAGDHDPATDERDRSQIEDQQPAKRKRRRRAGHGVDR
jgi:hypothetical protein